MNKSLRLFLFIILFFTSIPVFLSNDHAYEPSIQSIERLLNTQPDSAIELTEQLLLSKGGIDSVFARAQYLLATAYYYKGYYFISTDYYKRAIETSYARNNPKFKGRCMNNLGIVYDLTDQLELSLKSYIASMEIDAKLGDSTGVAQSQNNIGLLYLNMNQIEEAGKYLTKAKRYFKKTNDLNGQALTYHNFAKMAEQMGELDEYYNNLLNAARLYNAAGNDYEYANILEHLAQYFITQQQYQKANDYIEQAYDLAKKNKYKYHLSGIKITQASLLINTGKYEQAKKILNDIKIFNSRIDRSVRELFLLLYSQTLDFHNFKNNFYQYKDFIDSLIMQKNNQMVNELHVKYETQEKIEKIEQQYALISKNKKRLIATLIIAFVLLILLVIILLYHQKLRSSYNMLYKKEQKIHENFMQTIENAEKATLNEELKDSAVRNGDKTLWQKILQLMKKKEMYLNPRITLEDLAIECNSNKKYIYHAIKTFSQDSFSSFVNRFRVEKAKEFLLKNPNYSLKAIAEMSGFNSSSSFYRIFRDQTGLTPGKYRAISNKA